MAIKQDYDPKKELAAITEKALKGKGFVLFVGVVTDRKDKDGNYILDFHYTRHRYGFEEFPKTIEAFRAETRKDVLSVIGESGQKK